MGDLASKGGRPRQVDTRSFFFVCNFAASMGQVLFFFFLAEVGIRALIVTGVQTCALPICLTKLTSSLTDGTAQAIEAVDRRISNVRSEERRVGKACRSRWPLYR